MNAQFETSSYFKLLFCTYNGWRNIIFSLVFLLYLHHSKARVVIGITKWTRRMVPTTIWNCHGAIEIWYNWNFLTTFFRETEKFWVNNCPISIKFGAFLVWSVPILNTKFHQNRTIFWPYFGCEMHIKGRDIPKF